MARQMKDSGVEWIGEIPADWDSIKIKYTSWLKGRIGWDGLKSTEYIDDGPYLITGINFSKGLINWDSCYHISEERYNEDPLIHIKENDLLITKDGTIGKVAVAKYCPEQVSLNSGVLLIRNTQSFKYYVKFLYYTLLSDEFWLWYQLSQSGNSTIKHLYQEQFYNFEFAYPSNLEQQKIADFLDKKCSQIDTALEKTRTTIEEYKKFKQAIITKAVTKGIRGDRPMKDSGIEWIGEIPADWGVTRIGRLCFVTKLAGFEFTKDMCNNILLEGPVPIVRAQNIKMGRFIDNIHEFISMEVSLKLQRCALDKKCVLITFIGAGIGEVALFDKNIRYHLAPNVAKIEIRKSNQIYLDDKYLMYYLMSSAGQEEIERIKKATAQPSLSMETIRSIMTVIPKDIQEQQEIADYLDKKCATIDTLIAKKEQLITQLETYKKSLIYEYVTGKKEVV